MRHSRNDGRSPLRSTQEIPHTHIPHPTTGSLRPPGQQSGTAGGGLKSPFIQNPKVPSLSFHPGGCLGRAGVAPKQEGDYSPCLQSSLPPDSSRFFFFFISSLFLDKPLQRKSASKQLEQVPSAGGVWQAGSQHQPPNHSSSHLNEGERETQCKIVVASPLP